MFCKKRWSQKSNSNIIVFSCEFCELFKNTYFVEDLQPAGFETPEQGCLFNKVASLFNKVACCKFQACFSFLQISEVCSLKSIFWWSNGKLGERIHKPAQSGVVMEIRWKLHSQVVATHILTQALEMKEKEVLKNWSKWGKFSFYVMIHYLHMIEILTYLKNKKQLIIIIVNKKFKIFDFLF